MAAELAPDAADAARYRAAAEAALATGPRPAGTDIG
jgi:hypothetical protein